MNDINKKNNIEEKILDKISNEKIGPKPKWEFLLKNSYFWILGAITTLLGATSVAASIFVVRNIRWELYLATHDNMFIFAIEFIPYLWIILFGIFLAFSYKLIRKTNHGYKYHLPIIAGVIVLMSVVLGIIFADIGIGEVFDDGFGNRIPLHRGIEMHNQMLWNNPEDGLLVGEIEKMDDKFYLENIKGDRWELVTSHLDQISVDRLESGKIVQVVGMTKDDMFYICGVVPSREEIGSRRMSEEFFERKSEVERSKECEDVQPYRRLLKNTLIK